jgi:hypothetical protein
MSAIIFTYLACLFLTCGVLGGFDCIDMSFGVTVAFWLTSGICFGISLGMWSDRDDKEKKQEVEIASLKQKVEALEGIVTAMDADVSNVEENVQQLVDKF